MPRILLTGTYSSSNKGDAAMQWSMAHALRVALPGAELAIHAPFPEADRLYYTDMVVVGSSRRRLIRATMKLGWVGLCRLAGGLKSVARLVARIPDRELEFLAKADLVVDLSGDMLTEEHGPHLAYSHFVPLLMALWMGKPLYVCAQSIGPFGITRPLARYVLRRAAAVTVRDPVTLAYLQRIGVGSRAELTADTAFMLEPAPPERVDRILAGEGIAEREGFIGVSVSGLVAATYARRNRGRRPFAELMAAALDDIQEQLGAPVLFVSHVTGPRPSKDDRRLSRTVRDRMQRRAHTFVLEGDYRAEELKGIIGRCGMFVGARMHANIAALSSAVPVLAVSYSHKTRGIMQWFRLSEYVVAAESLDAGDVARLAVTIWSDRVKIGDRIRARLEATLLAARRNVDVAVRLTTPGPASHDVHAAGIPEADSSVLHG